MRTMNEMRRQPRRRRGGDRGDILIEVLVVIALIAVAFTSFGQSAISANMAQRTAQYTDVATQYGNGIIEKAKSLQWKNLGFPTSATDYRAVGPASQPTVNIATTDVAKAADGTAVLSPTSTATAGPFSKVKLTLRTDVTWKALSATSPSTPSSGPIPTDGSSFYAKQITVTVTWADALKVPHSIVLASTRTPTVSEAIPVGIANPTGPGNYVYPTITAVSMNFGGDTQLSWSASTRYATVIVERSLKSDFSNATTISTGVAVGNASDTGGTRGAINYYRVRAMTANGQAVASDPVPVFLQSTLAWSSGNLIWDSYATSGYTGALQMSNVEFGTAGGTVSTIDLTGKTSVAGSATNGNKYFRIAFTAPTGQVSYSNEIVQTTVQIVVTQVSQIDGNSITVAFDHSAASVGATSLLLQLSSASDFSGATTFNITDANATSATQSVSALAAGTAYVRVGYTDTSGTAQYGAGVSFTKYKIPTYTATVTNLGNITVTLGSGQTLSNWAVGATAATATFTVTPSGGTAANKSMTTSPQTFSASASDGANALKLVITTPDGAKITATGTASVTKAASPNITKFSALTGSAGTYTISPAPTTYAGSTAYWTIAIGTSAADALATAKTVTAANVSTAGTTTSGTFQTNVGAPYAVVIMKVGTTLYYSPAIKYR